MGNEFIHAVESILFSRVNELPLRHVSERISQQVVYKMHHTDYLHALRNTQNKNFLERSSQVAGDVIHVSTQRLSTPLLFLDKNRSRDLSRV